MNWIESVVEHVRMQQNRLFNLKPVKFKTIKLKRQIFSTVSLIILKMNANICDWGKFYLEIIKGITFHTFIETSDSKDRFSCWFYLTNKTSKKCKWIVASAYFNRNESKEEEMLRKLLNTNGTFHLNKNLASNVVHSSMHCATCKYLEDFFFVGFRFVCVWFLVHKCIEPMRSDFNFRTKKDETHTVLWTHGMRSAYPKELKWRWESSESQKQKVCVYL